MHVALRRRQSATFLAPLAVATLAVAACSTRAPDPPPASSRADASGEFQGPPPSVTACSTDSECTLLEVRDTPPDACCSACDIKAVTRKSRIALSNYCATRPTALCPPVGCANPILRAVCREGACAAVPDSGDAGTKACPPDGGPCESGGPVRREFRPKPVEPPFASVAASGDGTWTAVPNPWASETEPLAWKTVLHPDPKLKIATATIVAMDLTRLRLAMVAGKGEPRSTNAAIKRPAVVPQEHMDKLFAAFNGGFMTVHGQYGMKVNGELLLPAKDGSCTVAIGKDGDIRIATWTKLPGRDAFPHFRQTPPCLVEAGEINPVVDAPNRLQWGLAVEGTAVIRRSAIGIDAAGTTLYYAFGEAVSPRAIAAAMKALGVRDAAQLDVNYSFPRFLFYAHPEGKPPVVRAPLATPVQFRPTEYVSGTQMRDFLYVYRAR